MKKLLLLLVLLLTITGMNYSQTTVSSGKQVGNPESYMTPDQLAKYKADLQNAELQKKLETYGKWVGVGGEVGNAIKESLNAVVDVSDKFSKTDVGKFTMILVAWKIIGRDVMRIFLGLLFYFIITFLFIKVYRNTYQTKRYIVKKSSEGLFKKKEKEYELVEPDDDWDGYQAVKIAMLVLYAGATGLTYAIMFG